MTSVQIFQWDHMAQELTSSSKSQHRPIHGIIFDLDGTLIRSVVDFPKMKRRMIEYIQNLGMDDLNYTIIQTTNEIIKDFNSKMLAQGVSEIERDEILVKISNILTEVEFENIDRIELLPGVKEFVIEHQSNGVKLGILTRASQKYTIASLERTGIKDYFKVIASRDEFTLLRAKPHIDALEFVLQKLDCAPENTIFVGDHQIDYDCAQKGNIRFIGVLSGAYSREMLNNIGCEILVEDFNELSKLIKEINGNTN